jgi:hypothetical protein
LDFQQLFLQRYNPLYDFWLGGTWETVPADLMRQRPHARLNSIAWILWHLTRVEDAGLNSFVAERPQVFDDGDWMARLNLLWRHQGNGMTFAEVDELSQRIDVQALHGYSDAVRDRTREIITQLNPDILDTVMEEDRLRVILFDEGLAMPAEAEGLLKNYLGWTKGKCLMNFGMTHPYQHLGEIEAIATLLGVEWD